MIPAGRPNRCRRSGTSSAGLRQRPFETAPSSPLRRVAPAARTYSAATSEEIARWMAPEVRKFRGKLRTFVFVNGVIVIVVDLRAHGSATSSPCSGPSTSRSSTRSSGTRATTGATCSASRAIAGSSIVAGETIEEARGLFDQGARARFRVRRACRCRPCPASGAATGMQRAAGFDPNAHRHAAVSRHRCSARSRIATRFFAW